LATKLQMITDLSRQTARELTRSSGAWATFLKTAAWNYKYPFQDQVLIFAQKPNATACASIEFWNRRLNRWVNKGARGIALIDDSGSRHTMRHVFDGSDTNSRDPRPIPLWAMQDRYAASTIEALGNAFGELENRGDLPAALLSSVDNAIEDNYADYLSTLSQNRQDSFLEDLDDLNVKVLFKKVLRASVATMVLTRCGHDPDDYIGEDDLLAVTNFNTLNTVARLGAATSDISEMLLRQIEVTVRSLQRAEEKERCTFAKAAETRHNEHRDHNERMDGHGVDLHTERGLPAARPDAAGGSAHRQVWDVAQDAPQESRPGDVRKPDALGRADEPSVGDRPDGSGAGGILDGAAPGSEPRAGQGDRPDGLGGPHEQPEASGGGDGPGGADLQLTLPTVEEQQNSIKEAEEEKSSAFHIPQETVDAVLQLGSGVQDGKFHIYEHFQKNAPAKENVDFLRREYGTGGRYPALPGTNINEQHDGRGITILGDGHTGADHTVLLTWAKAQKRIGELISLDRYLNYEEKEQLFNYQRQASRQAAVQAYEQYAEAMSRKTVRYAIPLGATVFLGVDEYEVSTLGNEMVTLLDVRFPLLSKELPRMEFERLLRENPLNDRLIDTASETAAPTENGTQLSPTDLYRRYLSVLLNRVRRDDVYTVLRDRDTGTDSAFQALCDAMEHIVVSMREQHPAFYEAYVTLPEFQAWMAEDIFERTYQDVSYHRDQIEKHANDPAAPDWVRITANATLPRQRDTITIDGEESGDYVHVDMDVELPDGDTRTGASDLIVGTALTIDERRFVIDSIDPAFDRVSLQDVTFESGTGFPIFRSESITFVRDAHAQQELPVWKKAPEGEPPRVRIDPGPEALKQNRINYRITDDNLGHGGQKTKFGWNIAAIRLLKQLEAENRLATPGEQEVLCRYVGWGGLPQAFDAENTSWAKEYAELKELLDSEEYQLARGSTLNAHYTSPTVIKAIYTCLENMGFRSGNVLEPACGIGNFFGLVPDSMKDCKLYGVELDSVTGRIAKQLYQNVSIAMRGYETASLPDSFFDLAISNVPFGGYGVADKKYDKFHFHIHDYFFAKTLDKVRPGGIVAFISSKGTLDKRDPEVRKYIAQRADLLGAVRLPNNAFLANAGTEVTTDILFLQKRDRIADVLPSWVHLGQTEDSVPVNSYFIDNPDMMLGTMAWDDRMYGGKNDTSCLPHENGDLAEQLREALENIHAEYTALDREEDGEEVADTSILADPSVRNFSFTVVNSAIYYRENSRMNRVDTSITAQGRIKGMIALRDCARELIERQLEDSGDEAIREQQRLLNRLYDSFTAQYGLLNSRGNEMAFSDDSSYALLCSLEMLNEDGELQRKADMFFKRTIRQRATVTHVDTASEALAISIADKACVDMCFMSSLTGLSEEQLEADLQGVIFRELGDHNADNVPKAFFDIKRCPFVTADAYLSGNVRSKLKLAKMLAERSDLAGPLAASIKALEAVQPVDLSASEIDVRLGATWLPTDVVRDFMFELLDPPYYSRRYIDVLFSEHTANWNIKGKSDDRANIKVNITYGTNRINAYKIIEETLNLKDVRIFDVVYDDNGKETRVMNKKDTAIAQQKQEAIKEAFRGWVWKDPKRRERLTRIYNERFNSIRPREYDGSHIRFTGMNPEISLRKHQVDAIAHILYGGNTLLAHCVGAGKTYEMTAAAMESKHLGLCSKSLFVVPNHLTEQWAGEFLQLYPSANILVATKKDFETKNRRKFCARIATGDYDAVIIGHSQFERIPISAARQENQIREQIDEIARGVQELKENKGERYAIKQLEKTKKALELRLKKLIETGRKDAVVTFEELGVDRLFVDEADGFKNLFLYTKMRNVAGLAQTEAQKTSDLFMKCRYLDELTGGRGVVFATGTPISNSITEMYTMQRYLQYEMLRAHGLQHFDCWASTFGETLTAIELAPEGTGYRAKTRFARFYNLPELLSMFREVADIKTGDMLNLPVPKANYHNVAVKPSEFQRDMVTELAARAEKVRNRMVEPHEDNMLKITNDGRKLALDQRLANPILPDDEAGKVNACVERVFEFWQQGREKRLTQLVFCDLSTPKGDGSFNVYDDIRQKLIAHGVPQGEVAFIHEADIETRKKELYAKVRSGQVRILVGSTFKMGAGTNVQDRLIASHDLDCPWRPRDLEQRAGRIVRQGNKNEEVHICRYVTENTFDAYLYQIIENKQRFISQIMTSKSPVRSAEDIDETALSYAEVKALATGNPYIKEKMDLDIQVSRLKMLKANHLSQKYALEDAVIKRFPHEIRSLEERIAGFERDWATVLRQQGVNETGDGKCDIQFTGMTMKGIPYTEKADAGASILETCHAMTSPEPQEMGNYMGFPMLFSFDSFYKHFEITLRGSISHTVVLGTDVHGNLIRLNNALAGIPEKLALCREQHKTLRQQMDTAKEQIEVPFEKEQELQAKTARLAELNSLLNMDQKESIIMDAEQDDIAPEPERKAVGYER
jgi:N12 class adenine-specific DNA methylase